MRAAATGAGARLADALAARRDELLEIIVEIATYDSAADELASAVAALRGADREVAEHAPSVGTAAVFLPSNNLLYSYVLYGLIPSLYCDRVLMRPPARFADIGCRLHEALRDVRGDLVPARVELRPTFQREFLGLCAGADAVVFTGQHRNGLQVASELGPETPVLLFGSGPNPVVIGPEAGVTEVLAAAVSARLYNVGQDCLCADLYLVHADRARELVEGLCDSIADLGSGDRREPGVALAPLTYPDAGHHAQRFVDRHADLVVRPGRLDGPEAPRPVVLSAPWRLDLHPPEFFCPVFLVMVYERADQVRAWLATREERTRGMYVSVFGEPELAGAPIVGTSVVCAGQTTFAFEDGNTPFGGYGVEASGVSLHGEVAGRPLLLSAEMGGARR